MKLDDVELLGLKQMIEKSSLQTLKKHIEDNADVKKGGIVFAGDSMIQYMDLNTYFPNKSMYNRGIAGATTKSFLSTFDEVVLPLLPNKLFISIGSNDLVLLKSAAKEAADAVIHALSVIKEKLTDTQIYYLSTTPVLHKDHMLYKKIYVAGRTNDENIEINTYVKCYAKTHDIVFVQAFDVLKDDQGYLKEAYTSDGIHLNKKGYSIYKDLIMPFVE